PAPCALRVVEAGALAGLALAADDLADALELLRDLLVGGDDLVERVGDLAVDALEVAREPDGEVAAAHLLQRAQELALVEHRDGIAQALGRHVAVSCRSRAWA